MWNGLLLALFLWHLQRKFFDFLGKILLTKGRVFAIIKKLCKRNRAVDHKKAKIK